MFENLDKISNIERLWMFGAMVYTQYQRPSLLNYKEIIHIILL